MFDIYYMSLLGVFGIIIYVMILDSNVTTYVYLLLNAAGVSISRAFWMMRLYPRLKFDEMVIRYRLRKIRRGRG